MTLIPRYICDDVPKGPDFSVCSLVQSEERYARLIASFARSGFTEENTQFLAADNRSANRFDGYSWQKAMLAEARGRYVIYCHDDIELMDQGHGALLTALNELSHLDPNWLLAGIAGGRYRPQKHHRPMVTLRISDIYGENRRQGSAPGRVETLDECFILMRRARPVIGSYDLAGFHYYGPDLCLQAELLGGSAYVLDFHLRHHGHGTKGPSFIEARQRFVQKYARIFPGRTLHCTTGVIRLEPTDAAEGG